MRGHSLMHLQVFYDCLNILQYRCSTSRNGSKTDSYFPLCSTAASVRITNSLWQNAFSHAVSIFLEPCMLTTSRYRTPHTKHHMTNAGLNIYCIMSDFYEKLTLSCLTLPFEHMHLLVMYSQFLPKILSHHPNIIKSLITQEIPEFPEKQTQNMYIRLHRCFYISLMKCTVENVSNLFISSLNISENQMIHMSHIK